MKYNPVIRPFFALLVTALLAGTILPVQAADISTRSLPVTDAIGLVASANYQADNLTLDDHYLYPTFSSLSVVDLNPESLKLFQKFRTDYIFDLAVKGQYAYAAQQSIGLRVFDITVATPTIFSKHTISGGAFGLAVAGDNLLVTTGLNGLSILDTTKPYDMPIIGQLALEGFCKQVSVSGNLALVSAGKAGVHVVDISNPESPSLISTIDTPAPAENATLEGTTAYLALGLGGMEIVDLKDPAKPTAVSTLETLDFLRRVVIKDNLAYLAERDAGIRIVNVVDPATPVPLAMYNTYGGAWDIVLKDNNIYVADYPYGLVVLRFNPPLEQAIPAQGGSIDSAVDGVRVLLPAGAFESAVDFRHEPLPAINTPIGPEPTLVKAGPFFRNSAWNGETAVKPGKPYAITVKANTTGLTERQINSLSLYYWDPEIKRWRKDVSTRLDVVTGILTATPSRLGTWGVFYDRNDSYSTLPPTATPAVK
jgi:hypothetical protein